MPVLGTSAECIDLSEDRRRFEQFLGNLGIPQPPGAVSLASRGAESGQTYRLSGVGTTQLRARRTRYGKSCTNASELSHYMSIAHRF